MKLSKAQQREVRRGRYYVRKVVARATRQQLRHAMQAKSDVEFLLRLAELAVLQ